MSHASVSGKESFRGLFHNASNHAVRPRPSKCLCEWLVTRDGCDTRACLREAMTERLWRLSEAVGPDLPAYSDEDADAELVVADLGAGWYAIGAVGYWHGPTENSAAPTYAATIP